MIAIDTNVLVYAHRVDDVAHDEARRVLAAALSGAAPWAVPAPVLSEYLRVMTNPRFSRGPIAPDRAIRQLDEVVSSPAIRVIGAGTQHWSILREVVRSIGATGNDVFDARIVAICVEHGVERILTEDRGYDRFAQMRAVSLRDHLAG